MSKGKSQKAAHEWANVMKVYNEVIKEKGKDAPWLLKSHLYRLVAERTHYAEETVKQIISKSIKNKPLSDPPN